MSIAAEVTLANPDWFRTSEWGPAAQEDFEARLRRAKPSNRAQYLRIKAGSLAASGEIDGALTLLERVLDEHGTDVLQAPMARCQRAELFEAQGHLDDAESDYRQVIAIHRQVGHRYGNPELRLAELLLRRGSRLAYQVALIHLMEELPKMLLTSQRFRGAAAAARMHREFGNREEASALAAQALRIAEEPQPLLPRHPSLDAGWSPDPQTMAELSALASG